MDIQTTDNAKEILRSGQNTEFWKLLCGALDESIAHLREEQEGDDIKELPAEQYKIESELLKAKVKYLSHLKNLPETLIAYITPPAGNIEKPENFDPYFTNEEIKRDLLK